MKTFIKTIKYMDFVENAPNRDYKNGILEDINNKIKVIRRIAFVYKCFYHLKAEFLPIICYH